MQDADSAKELSWVILLLAANLVVMAVIAVAIVFGLLPKIERVVQTTERVEARFQAFADEVQPVVSAGAGKAVETIKKVDSERLSKTATEKTNTLIDAAAERAKRMLESDRKTKE